MTDTSAFKKPKTAICYNMFHDATIDMIRGSFKDCTKTKKIFIDESEISKELFYNHPESIRRKSSMIHKNELPTNSCESCINNTGNIHFNFRNEYAERTFTEEEKNKLFFENNKNNFIINVNNICNLKCIYCSEGHSSEWARETGITFQPNKNWSEKIITALIEMLKDKNFRETKERIRFSFTGGEPTINDDCLNLIHRLIDIVGDFKNVQITITSNMNTKPTQHAKYLALSETYKNVTFRIYGSVDGLYDRAEAIRTNLNWDLFIKNLDASLNTRYRVKMAPSLNAYSAYDLSDFFKFFNDFLKKYNHLKEDSYNMNIVTQRPLSTRYFPSHIIANEIEKAAEVCFNDNVAIGRIFKTEIPLLGTLQNPDTALDIEKKFKYFKSKRPEYDWDNLFPHVPETIAYFKEKFNLSQ